MAKRKPTPAIVVGPAPAFFQPGADALRAAGFYQSNASALAWVWKSETGGGPAGGTHPFWIYIWLHPKGEIFVHHVNKPRAAEKPFLTSVGTGPEFTALIERFGWKRPGQ